MSALFRIIASQKRSKGAGVSLVASPKGRETRLILILTGYVLLIGIVVHLFVVFFEEPSLRRRFGESYEAYLRTVPRWLPRFPSQHRV
jgi:protein-S-isoprenylcysteine O-methyltransferase Ste14